MHGRVAVHLESHIQFMDGGSPRRIAAVYIVSYTVIGEAHEHYIGGGALEFPGQVVPDKRCGSRAGDAGRKPVAGGIAPHVPMSTLDVALCAIDEFVGAVRLVVVKFQSLVVKNN